MECVKQMQVQLTGQGWSVDDRLLIKIRVKPDIPEAIKFAIKSGSNEIGKLKHLNACLGEK